MKNKKLVLKRLKATRKKMSYLRDGVNFDYSEHIKKDNGRCGTVCCVAGWYPKWFPKAGLKWRPGFVGLELTGSNNSPWGQLEIYHKIDECIVNALFYGHGLILEDGSFLCGIGPVAPIRKVREHWDRIISEIEKDNV